jgi:UDP-glucose 4-epimerase
MKVFVTGGAGFIGRHLIKSLLGNNHTVTIFDDFSNSSEEGIKDLVNCGVIVVKGDIRNFYSLLNSISDHDIVIHLAAKIDVEESVRMPEVIHDVNVTGTINLLRACMESGVVKIVAASTAAVYGNAKILPIEETSPTNPISPYGASKLAMEYYLQTFSNCYDLNCISLRFFNIYGKGQSSAYAGVITKFMEKIRDNRSLDIFGDGLNSRDLVAVEDVVNAIQLAMKNINGKKGNVYNIASGKSTTINDLAKLMISISGKTLSIRHNSPRDGDIPHSKALVVLAQKELGYFPNIKLKGGLQNLYDSQKFLLRNKTCKYCSQNQSELNLFCINCNNRNWTIDENGSEIPLKIKAKDFPKK